MRGCNPQREVLFAVDALLGTKRQRLLYSSRKSSGWTIVMALKPIPLKIRKQLEAEMPTAVCARVSEGGCRGRLTIEHAFGRVQQPRWSLIFLCWRHHLGDGLDKEINKYYAYLQATDADLRAYKAYEQMKQEKLFLIGKYGEV